MSQGTHWHGCHTAHLDCAIAKIERLEAELKTEQALSFRNQVATLEAERDAAVAVLIELRDSAVYWSEYDVPLGIVDRINAAIDAARGKK